MSDTLHIFAVNAETDMRHTHLTRTRGEERELPPLTEWLGAEVDTAEIELFPVGDLGDMSLSEYVTMAFGPESIAPQAARRMDALKGHVLLVPESALSEEPAPGREATLIATLPLAAADHDASLPKADVTPMPRPDADPLPEPRRRGSVIWLLGAVIALALLIALVVT
jgi:hypothetical protein